MNRTLIETLDDGTKVYEVTTDAGRVIIHDHTGLFTQEETNRSEIESKARDALVANRAFIAIASPSNAQNAAQLKALTRQVNGLIRLTLGDLEGTD